jgi:transposase InsO family protein
MIPSIRRDLLMPWKEVSVVNLRKEFIDLARSSKNFSRLCENFEISRKTGYKWIERFESSGQSGLKDLPRRPANSPKRISGALEEAIKRIRKQHCTWGGRKIRRRLQNLGYGDVPSASTITEVLKRNGLIDPFEGAKHSPFQRFEHPYPNDLWQMDFKGHVACPEGRCHPLTILDDCSRYALALKACLDERRKTAQNCLIETFRRYGLPNQIITDNGSPWGNHAMNPYTRLTVWLMQLGILISHSAPAHPQTLGKDERFHRTLKAELLGDSLPWRKEEAQRKFDDWRFTYNHHRPHEALDLEVPASRYHVSNRPFTQYLPTVEYGSTDIVRKVQNKGIVHFRGREFRVPRALVGYPIALRPKAQCDDSFEIYYVRQLICVINLNHHD